MNNFIRTLRDAIPYWRSILIATACSFVVAVLWGANIGAFYPILEITIGGQSVEQWVDQQVSQLEEKTEEANGRVNQISSELTSLSNVSNRQALEQQLQSAKTESDLLKKRLITYQQVYPYVQKYLPNDPFQTIVLVVSVLLISTLVRHGFMIANDYLVGRVAVDLTRDTRNQLFSKAIHMDRAGFAKFGASTFQGQIAHTADVLCTGLTATLGAAIREPLKLISCLVGAAFICPRLLLLSLIVAPIVGWILYWITRKIRSNTRRMLARTMNFHGVMVETLGNIQTVQAYQMEHHEDRRFADATLTARKYRLRTILLASASKPVIEFLGVGMLGVTIVAGAYLVLNRQTQLLGIPICSEPLSVSALLVFFGMLIGASDPLRRLSAVYWQIYSGIVAAETIYATLDEKPTILEQESATSLSPGHQVLSLRNVDFGYVEGTNSDASGKLSSEAHDPKWLLRDVTIDIPFGTTLAIVGPNGSGKSTLIHLLCRFYDPQQGAILLDGTDYRQMKIGDIRARIALVNQHTELFDETIDYNIRYGNPNATEDQVRSVARQAQAAHFIENALEQGYQTRVGANGHKLSGGQRQRLALARALLRNPEILILDEATSQIDMESEQLIRQSLAAHRGQRTMIIITHREKLLELADIVFEVRNGQLIRSSNATQRQNQQREVA